jgi:hypothetical protein
MSSNNFNKLKKHFRILEVVVISFVMLTAPLFFNTATAYAINSSKENQIESIVNDKIEQNNDERANAKRDYERVIAHGGGTVAGFDTSSSVDAVMQSIYNGFKVIELDMEFSSDNQIIMLHDWDRTIETYLGRDFGNKLSESQFNGQLICGKFEPLTFKKLVEILDANSDVRIVTDTKGDNIKLLTTIAQRYPNYVDRMIPQIYHYDEYDAVADLGYKDIIITLYAMESVDCNQLLSFVKEKNIYAVTMPSNYAVMGLEKKLTEAGAVVYTHPIYTVEEAQQEFLKGAYGIYSSTLIPSEIEGSDARYYLLQEENGKEVKLTDMTLTENTVRQIKIKGIHAGISLKYKLDGVLLETALSKLENFPFKAHDLTIELWDLENTSEQEPVHIMNYALTKDEGEIRLLDKKYEYRLAESKDIPKFDSVIANSEETWLDEDTKRILAESFISKAGEYYYYNNGESGKFSVGDELISSQKSINGMVIVPLADTIKLFGAQSVVMDVGKYVYINMEQERILSQINSAYISKGAYQKKVSAPISIYRSKAMAGGEVLEIVTERSFLDNKIYLIILPEGTEITKQKKEKLLRAAELLY